MSQHSKDYKEVAVKHYLEGKDDMRDTCNLFKLKHYIKKESPNAYDDIYNVITEIIEKKITREHLTN
jgi:hypothetical protein